MNKQLFVSTAIGLILGTAAFAQSPTDTTKNPPPSAQTQTSPSSSSSTSTPSAQSTAPAGTSAQTSPSNTTTSQSAPASSTSPSQAQTAPSSNTPSQAQSSPSSSSPSSGTSPSSGSSPSQAQTTPPAGSTQPGGSSSPSQAQTSNPPPANSQAQQAPNSNTSTTAQQPNQSNAAQSASTSTNASANINDQQRTRVTQSISRLNVQPLNNVNFSVSVGAVVPRDVHLQPLPADVVEVVPQYRGYDFFVVRDEIVIVEPSTYKIVTVLPRSGGSTAVAPAPSRSRASFTEKDREVVRKHVRAAPVERRTTGSASTRVEIRRGERLPDSVEVEEFPETVYREAPSLREYRYIHRENRTYLVDPGERRVIEEID
jgi:hypothetical protein